jgi:hypothetical protein
MQDRRRMSRLTFEQLRVPAVVAVVALAAFAFLPRDASDKQTPTPEPTGSVVVGEPGGAVIATPTAEPSRTPIPTVAAVATPTPTPRPTPGPNADDFGAEVLACRAISGSRCSGQLGTLPPSAGSFTALVRFTAGRGGDTLNAILDGPSGRIEGFPYTLEGGGAGYYYTTFTVGGLPSGDYTLTATRNGNEVAVTSFRMVGS